MRQTPILSFMPGNIEPKIYPDDVLQITKEQSNALNTGDVILVNSDYKHEVYGYHYSIITGKGTMRERGIRPELIVIPSNNKEILDSFVKIDGATILLLSPAKQKEILDVYRIRIKDEIVIWPSDIDEYNTTFV